LRSYGIIFFHVGGRLLLAAVFFALLLRSQSLMPHKPAPKPVILPTTNLDLQLARLYLQAEDGWTPAERQALADLWTLRGESDRAARLTADAPSASVLLQNAQTQAAAGDWLALAETYAGILQSDPQNQTANFGMALLQVPQGDPLPYMQRAAALAGEHQASAAALLGILQVEGYTPRDVALPLVERGEFAHAERLLSLHIEQNNLDALAYAYRGFARDQLGRDGLPDIEQALALEPTAPIPFFMLGMHYRQAESFDLSLQAFLDAHLLAPQNPALAAEVAAAYQLNDDLQLAETWYQLAVELAPTDSRFAGLLAAFYAETAFNLEPNGVPFVRQAAADYPDQATLLASWGRVLYHSGDFEGAAAALEAALGVAPQDFRARFFRAELLERQGQRETALEDYFYLARSENSYQEAAQRGVLRLGQ